MPTVKKWKDALKKPEHVESLDLDCTQLGRVRFPAHRVLPPEIGRFTALRRLRIRTRNLGELCPELGTLPALESLTIDAGEMVLQFHGALAALPALKTLDLGSLGLTGPIALPESLEVLSIHGNDGLDLAAWAPALAALPNLRELELNACLHGELPDAIGQLRAVKALTLRDNGLIAVPDALLALTGLQTLDLAGNQLADLPAGLGGLSGLEALQVHNNRMEAVPDTIRRLTGLRTLLLDHNPLREVPDWLGELRQLHTLGLSVTGLRDLPPSLLSLPLRRLYVDAPPAVVEHTRAHLPRCKVVSRSRADVDAEGGAWLRFLGKA